ncbi:MAG TPA: DUF4214 domain-containing protein [Gemmataceae bacterium]|nr:DUF4214 domain-containing protein [Gemmataceae bacterium]
MMGSTKAAFLSRRTRLLLEELETRQVLSGFQPSAVEQLFLQELNAARADPAAYGASIGVDLSAVAPSPPLAFNTELVQAARLHSQDMNDQGYFSHNTPNGVDPGQRISSAGFSWTGWGESIAGGIAFPGPNAALEGLITDAGVADLGHRRQLLDMDPIYQNQNQVGIGIVQAGTGPLVDYYTIDTASSPAPGIFLTGVVMNDTNGNGQYDIGEGIGGVTITVAGVGSVTTWGSGGYTMPITPGTYMVTASGGALAAPTTESVTVGSTNVQLDFVQGNAQYVTNLYRTILGRTPAPAEITTWESALQGPLGMAGVASAIENSAEARTRLVDAWYQTYLGRQPADGEQQVWVNDLLNGASQEDVLSAILGSQEFFNRSAALITSGSANAGFIESLYTDLLGRNPASSEVTAWLGVLQTEGTTAVADAFLHSTEYRSDVVTGYYASILHRTTAPTSQEVADWVNSGLDLTGIQVSFDASNEYYLDG